MCANAMRLPMLASDHEVLESIRNFMVPDLVEEIVLGVRSVLEAER